MLWVADTKRGSFEGENLAQLAKQIADYYDESPTPTIKRLVYLSNQFDSEIEVTEDGIKQFEKEIEDCQSFITESQSDEDDYDSECAGLIYDRF